MLRSLPEPLGEWPAITNHSKDLAHTVSVARMQQIDAAAIDTIGIPRLLLMEHAGLAVARLVQQYGSPVSTPVLVCCGTGYNGGDGLAAARHLQAWGYPLRVLLFGQLAHLRTEPSIYAAILKGLGVSLMACSSSPAASTLPGAPTGPALPREVLDDVQRWLGQNGLIIDALLGLGARGQVREPMTSVIRWMNQAGHPIIAVDLPSGLDGDTGCVQGVAVKATITMTFGLIKQGCMLEQGPSHVGSLMVDAITIPQELLTL